MSDMNLVKLKDLTLDNKGHYGIGAAAVERSEDLPTYLRITDINEDGTLDYEGLKSVDSSDTDKYYLQENDIVFARTGNSTGKNYLYDGRDGKLVYAGFLIKFSLNPEIVNPLYVKYYCMTKEYWGWVEGISTGSTRKNINAKMFGELEIPLPIKKVQDKVVKILNSLDEKVRNNNKIIKNIEEQAQAIFKSWFVDFEPFQDEEFVDSDLGKIPEGWEIISLDDMATYKNGLAMQKYRPENEEESLPVLKIKELRANRTNLSSDRCSKEIPKEVLIDDGDIIFSWSGSLLVEIWTGGQAGLNQHLFKVTSDKYHKWFYYYWTKFFLNQFIAIARDRATTMGHIKRSHLKDAQILIPNEEYLRNMIGVMDPIVEKLINLGIQNGKLAEIRDTLLPKLMSGEIHLGDVELEKVVETKI